MKTKYTQILALLAALSAFALAPVQLSAQETATGSSATSNEEAEQQVEIKNEEEATDKRSQIIEEARSAIRETQNALKALDEKDTETALEALERATGKLNIVLAREPELVLAPVGVTASTQDLLANADIVEAFVEEAEDALEDGRVQDARRIVALLASETVISVRNLPLGTYPAAMLEAAALLDEDKVDEAKVVLQTALNSQVVINYTIPLPVARAEALLAQAEKLAEEKERSDANNDELTTLLDSARSQLELAEALGYGTHKQFANIYKEIDKIEEKTEDGKSGTGFFDKIKKQVEGLFESSQTEK